MKIKRFNENEDYVESNSYESNKIYYMLFNIETDDVYNVLLNCLVELTKNEVDYSFLYNHTVGVFFIFIYPDCHLRNILKYEYISSSAKSKEDIEEEYLGAGYKIIRIEDIPIILNANKFNI